MATRFHDSDNHTNNNMASTTHDTSFDNDELREEIRHWLRGNGPAGATEVDLRRQMYRDMRFVSGVILKCADMMLIAPWTAGTNPFQLWENAETDCRPRSRMSMRYHGRSFQHQTIAWMMFALRTCTEVFTIHLIVLSPLCNHLHLRSYSGSHLG